MSEPARPTELTVPAGQPSERLGGTRVPVPPALLERWQAAGIAVSADPGERAWAGRDWWPLSIGWAARGALPAVPAVVVAPRSTAEVSAVLAACNEAGVPVTPVGGGSGVCGGSVPVFGGVSLDLRALAGLHDLDEVSLVADVGAGTFGGDLDVALSAVGPGYTVGHRPQSVAISTVGGWIACRGAGQYSTRYGKIEDLVVGLEVVLADGTVVRTDGRAPRAATGPGLSQLFVGSEGTLGVITSARLRVAPAPQAEVRRAFGFGSFAEGLHACRQILRRGATPAVLRLYDRTESMRHFDAETCVLIVLDEGDRAIVDASAAVCDQACAGATRLDDALVARWLEERNDTSALGPLWQAGIVVDTIEVAGRWSVLATLADQVVAALQDLEGTLAASVHQSHAYPDGACLYFTVAGRRPDRSPDPELQASWQEAYYRAAWETALRPVVEHGAAISHHHGIGLNRGRFLEASLGSSFAVLRALKAAVDPNGILNPGKLGLDSPFGPPPWP